jgi:tetratricopeptide (TPR) repeat protein
MSDRPRRLIAALALLALGGLPLAGSAQTEKFYRPPKVLKLGSHSAAVAGNGAVQVKVFIKKDGTIGSATVVKSSNHADDAAALQIAKSSSFRVGTLDGVPGDYFYTVLLKFNGAQVSSGDMDASGLAAAMGLVRAGKYDDAKTEINAYLSAHPGDKGAEALLGVADGYLGDASGAATAFDAAGTIPPNYRVVAAKAYSDAAIAALKNHQNDEAIALGDKALALQQNVNTYFILGTAHTDAHQFPAAIVEFEKAKSLALSGKADAATLDTIDSGLMAAYLFGGETDKGLALAQDLRKRDPSSSRIDDTLVSFYTQQAVTELSAGKRDQAVATLEAGAAAVPKRASALYVQAANIIAGAQPPDWKKVKAEADKALAADPSDAHANFLEGVSLANTGDRTGAVPYLQKAKANAGSDASLITSIDAALKAVGQK